MISPIAIEITAGPLRGRQPAIQLGHGLRLVQETIALPQPARLKVGRALDCQICLPADDDQVSRHHFLLEIGSSSVRVRDGGSRNGTYVNGLELGQAPENEPARFSQGSRPVELELKDGDHILAGQTVFRVRIGERAAHAQTIERSAPPAIQPCCRWPGLHSLLRGGRHDQSMIESPASAPESQRPLAAPPQGPAGGDLAEAGPVLNSNDGQAAENPSARLFRLLLHTTGLIEGPSAIS